MNSFEEYIKKNKTSFNDKEVVDKEKLWINIASKLDTDTPKIIRVWSKSYFKIAASIALLVGLSFLLITLTYDIITFTYDSNSQDSIAVKELQDIDIHYKNLVSSQIKLIKNHSKLSEPDKIEFLSFIEELDIEYDALKLEMKKNLDNELVLEAIILNYKKRIELIENLLRQINENKKKQEDNVYVL